jgi:L-2-hydroxyglutarate oxidase
MLDSDELKTYEPHVRGVKALHVPQTGIMDYKLMAERMAARIEQNGGVLASGEAVEHIQLQASHTLVKTSATQYETKLLVNCAGLYSDKIAKLTHPDLDYRIIPFRGEYFNLKPEAHYLVNNLIYPVPDPNFPFLGVHFTREIDGNIEAGPNAVFAFEREGYQRSDFNLRETMESLSWPGFQKVATKYWRTGLGEMYRSFSKSAFTEMYRSFSKSAFTKALQKLVPDIRQHHLDTGGAGVRAQACDRHGGLVDDFVFFEDEGVVHVLNAPSPAATSCLSIGDTVADKGLGRMAGEKQVISEQESHNSG